MSRLSVAASRRLVLGGLASLPLAAAFGAPARADRSGADLILIVMADLHSPYRALPSLLRAVKDVAAGAHGAPVAILVNGDVFERGNAVAKNAEGMVDWAFLGALAAVAPLVINIGNHEVALRDDLATFVSGAQRIGARVIGNVMDNRSGGFYAPVSTRLTMGNRKIGILGLAPSDPMVWREAARAPLGLMDAAAFAGSAMPTAFAGVDLPVVLSHAGLGPDKRILPALPAGALMIGGHDHLALEHRENGGLYLHPGCWGESIEVISVTFDGAAPQMTAETVAISPDMEADRSIQGIVNAATLAFLPAEAREVLDRTLAHWPTALVVERREEAGRRRNIMEGKPCDPQAMQLWEAWRALLRNWLDGSVRAKRTQRGRGRGGGRTDKCKRKRTGRNGKQGKRARTSDEDDTFDGSWMVVKQEVDEDGDCKMRG